MTKKVAIIICFNAWNTLSTDTTIDFLKSIFEKTDYNNYEIILYENNSKPELLQKIFDYINYMSNYRKIVLISPVNKVWYNMNREYNDAIHFTDAEILVFANNDMKIINKEWLVNLVKWIESHPEIGIIAPHTNITFGNYFSCKNCPLINKQLYSCLFTEGCIKKYQAHPILWYREWPSLGIYACKRETLEKIGMHDTNIDLHGQDLSTMVKFENGGFKIAVAMDSLVEHYGDTGHLTLDYIAKDGSDDYNFRSIYSYKKIYEYVKQNEHIKKIHPQLYPEFDKWYRDFYTNQTPSFSRDAYKKWVCQHDQDHNPTVKYNHMTISLICTLQNPELTKLAINAIESTINSIKDANREEYEIIIYENNSQSLERAKLFEYFNKMKLKTDIPIKWISVSHEKFNINKIYNRITRFTKSEILCFANQDIEVINKEWARNAMNWAMFSENRDKIGMLLSTAHESTPLRHSNIQTVPKHELEMCRDTPMPIFFIKRHVLELIGGFNENFAFGYADNSLYEKIRSAGLDTYVARDVLIKHYENRPLSNPTGEKIDMKHDLET